MKRVITNTLAAAVLLCNYAYGQTARHISGQIADSATSQPLPGASIVLKKLSGEGNTQTAVCDAKGGFSFSNLDSGYYDIEISYTGYKNTSIDSIAVNGTGNAVLPGRISLAQKVARIASVVVTAKQPLITQTAEKIVFNVGKTSLAAGSNAYELAKTTPQVMADQNGNLTVQGRPVLVTIDGKQTNLSGDDLKNYLGSIAGQTVDKIEVITNPSARYDAQGGAIINIKTLRPENLGTNGTYTIGAGSGKYTTYNTGMNLNYRNKTTNIYGSYNFDHNTQFNQSNHTQQVTGFAGKVYEECNQTVKKDNHSIKLGIDHDFNQNNAAGILLKANISAKDMDAYNRSFAYTMDKLHPDSSSNVASKGRNTIFSPSVNAWYKRILNKKGSDLTLNADYFIYRKKWNEDFKTDYFNPGGGIAKDPDYIRDNSPADNTVQSYAADYTAPVAKGKIEAGIKATFTKTDNNILWENKPDNEWVTDEAKTNHFIYRENINAAYISASKMTGKYILAGGLRAEQTNTTGILTGQRTNKNNYINLFPSASVTYMKSAADMLAVSYRRSIIRYGFNFVNPFINYQSQYSYSQGNPYLKPQINNSFNFTWSHKQFLFATLTYTHAAKALAPVYLPSSDPNVVISSYDNLQSSDSYTATLTLSKKLTKWWQTTNSATGMHMVFKNTGKNAFNNNSGLTASVNSINSFTISKGLSADITGVYRSPLASGIYHLSSIITANTGLTATVLNGKGSLKLNVTDIFNSLKIRYSVNYQDIQSDYYLKAESRYANLLFTYRFGNNKVKESKVRKTGTEEERTRMGN